MLRMLVCVCTEAAESTLQLLPLFIKFGKMLGSEQRSNCFHVEFLQQKVLKRWKCHGALWLTHHYMCKYNTQCIGLLLL